ncbi:hypothetical protein K505DRAFT_48715 [Melanomma pulvis-pyrius CBS 109.77]|uniref:C2H2-type domain-containing protein n=1 Tax=Melanomma pulvis-pyrius CBS 109.77 TaxID=1314802 RepID=A0A6A6XA25_9PLEO|nr:hypothetical protein K505DRAFT_48715 [Melanomma pulvis-pyrius CBS 109.77]
MPSETLDASFFPPFPGDWSLFGNTSTDIESQNPNESTTLSADHDSHICKHCGKIFPRQCDLNKHMKLHIRPYRCLVKDCPKSWSGFIQQSHLDRHMNAVHREQLSESVEYHCPKENCRMQTWRKDGMTRHIKTQHPGEQGEPIRKIVTHG